ncbi:MAG: hypothetical protein Q8T09_16500 [Candidatus Melainabacteria bacterium]|nr:hypothetical protein [Candidatus Melainabacteria bacterium]
MVYSQFEGAEASQLNAVASRSESASSRMFAEVGNYQVAGQAVISDKSSNYSAEKSAQKKEVEKMLNQFGIDDAQQQQLKPKPIDPGHCPPWMNPDKHPDKHPAKPVLPPVKPESPDKNPQKYPDTPNGKPWRPELGVCAPGSPYKIDCFDEKESKRKVK